MKKGFTLVEIIVVMVIIAILAAFLVPALSRGRKKARYTSWVALKHSNESDPDCVAYYPFEEGEGEKLKNHAKAAETDFGGIYPPDLLDGTISGATWLERGRFEEKPCLYFDGNDYIDCGNSVSANIEGEITLEAWVSGRCSGTIISKSNGTTYFSLSVSGNKPSGTIGETIGSKTLTGSSTINDDKWHQLVLTYNDDKDEDNINLYCDGKNCAHDSTDVSLSAQEQEGSTLTIGSNFTGKIDEVAIYKKELTSEEIKDRYEKGK